MKRHKEIFIRRLLVFTILFLLILMSLNFFYIKNIGDKKLIFIKETEWQDYKSQLPNSTLEYAILGDSHARNGLNPSIINGSFNFGLGYDDYTETYYRINKIIYEENITIKNFILELDTHTFSDKMRTDQNLFKKLDYYSNFVSIGEISRLTGKSRISLSIQSKIRIIGKGKEILWYLTLPHDPTPLNLGWTNYSGNFADTNREEGAENKYKEHFSIKPVLMENRSFEHFKKILEIANKEGISVIIIEYPLSYEYSQEIERHNISREELYKSLFEEINKTNSEYLLLDYYDTFFDKPEYFVNSDHLNWIGAEVLSKDVNKELLNWK